MTCGGPTKKHHYRIERYTKVYAVLVCKWTMCRDVKYVHIDVTRALTLKGN